MTQRFLSLFLLFSVVGCGVTKKKTTYRDDRKITVEATAEPKEITPETPTSDDSLPKSIDIQAEQVIKTALTFSGVRYKFGGTTNKGMDCSGLLYVSFAEHNIAVPRASYQMAEEGEIIPLKKVNKGDLLFFGTSKRKNNINHVGLVVQVEGDDIKFIHSTSSRGVIVSSLREGYWNYAFIKAARIL